MKKSNKCPKCNSQEIIRIPGRVSGVGAGNIIMTGMTVFSAVKVTRYLCTDCGFSEEWIDDPKDIEKLKNIFKTKPR
jgi:predicted nucleic-acid-binding Zn-ribbon protein